MTYHGDRAQTMTALALANRHRLARAARHHEIADLGAARRAEAHRRAADLALELPPELATLTISDFLGWLPRVGPHYQRRILNEVNEQHVGFPVSEGRELGKLTFRQSCVLARVLRERADTIDGLREAAA